MYWVRQRYKRSSDLRGGIIHWGNFSKTVLASHSSRPEVGDRGLGYLERWNLLRKLQAAREPFKTARLSRRSVERSRRRGLRSAGYIIRTNNPTIRRTLFQDCASERT